MQSLRRPHNNSLGVYSTHCRQTLTFFIVIIIGVVSIIRTVNRASNYECDMHLQCGSKDEEGFLCLGVMEGAVL